MRDKSYQQQRVTQLKHRQNELKLELAMTKTFLLMDKSKTFDQHDCEWDVRRKDCCDPCVWFSAHVDDEQQSDAYDEVNSDKL